MLYSGKISKFGFVVFVSIVLIFICGAWAAAGSPGSQVAVAIPEICRFRVDNLREIVMPEGANQSEAVTEVTVAILSNSRRTWRLMANPASPATMEWSLDQQTWQPLRGSVTLLRGGKSFWNNYHLYYRTHPMGAQSNDLPQIQYQLYYEN